MKTNATFAFPKSLKTLIAYTSTSVADKHRWKNALIQSQAYIQDKLFKGKFVMNYDVRADGTRPKPKKDERKPA